MVHFNNKYFLVFFILAALTGCTLWDTLWNQEDITTAAVGSSSSSKVSETDAISPVVLITAPTNGQEIPPDMTIYGYCSDNTGVLSVTLYYYTNNGPTNFTGGNLAGITNFSASLPDIDYGDYTLFSVAMDAAGNAGYSPPVSVIVASVPSVNFISPVSNGAFLITNVTSVSFSGNATVSNASVTNVKMIKSTTGSLLAFTNDTSYGAGSWNYTPALTANATNILSIYSLADNGKQSPLNSISALVDTVLPTLNVVSPVPSYTNVNLFSIFFNSSDSLSGLSRLFYILNNSTNNLSLGASSFNLSGLTQSSYALSLNAQDSAGNIKTTNINFGVDWTYPIISINPLPLITNTSTFSASVVITEAGSGVASRNYRINSGAPQTFAGNTINVSGLTNGSNTIYCWLLDNVGYSSTTQNTAIVVDTVVPTVNMNLSAYTNRTNFSIPVSQTDNVGIDKKFYIIDGGAPVQFATSSIPVTGFAAGSSHTVKFWAVDLVGNISATNTKTVTIDMTAPLISLSSITGDINDWDTEIITGTSSDALSGIETNYCDFENISYSTIGSSPVSGTNNWTVSLTGLYFGTHTVEITTYDKAGNYSSVITNFEVF